jgi:DNA-binding NarL/FixJ family response regulator
VSAVVAAVDDFFFASKLKEAARQTSTELVFPTSVKEVVDLTAQHRAKVVLLDLNGQSYSRIEAVRALKRGTRAAQTVGYLSHVMTDLKKEAEEAGCDRVLARSAFVKLLPSILREAA